MSITVTKASPDCSFYFLRFPRKMSLRLNGPRHSVLNLSAKDVGIMIRMTGGRGQMLRGCKTIIGDNSYIAGAKAYLLNTDLIIKKKSLWSDEILIQGSNQHGIVDLKSKTLIDYGRNRITLEPHVWIGRRAILQPGSHIGAGSILGTGAIATKRYPQGCIIGGNPGRIIKRNRSWCHHIDRITPEELASVDRYVTMAESQAVDREPSRIRSFAQSIWLKAVAAGAAGAAVFEGFTEMVYAA